MTHPPSSNQASAEAPLYRQAQEWLLPALTAENAVAIDATCGNGHDTLFLCKTLGAHGCVYGLDLQQSAIEATRKRLSTHGFSPILQKMDHSEVEAYLESQSVPIIHAAIFNLGYLPGGDHGIITRAESTLKAIRSITARRAPIFRMSIVAYRGHPGGAEEAKKVRELLFDMDYEELSVITREALNRETGPIFFGIREKPAT